MEPPDSQRRFFDAALELLASQGYGALKLAPLCRHLGLTTGAFYHSFESWQDFTDRLLQHWVSELTTRYADLAGAETDPRARTEVLLQAGVTLPHQAEAAIRVWAGTDPAVRELQDAVDAQRLEIVRDAMAAATGDLERADRLARTAMYLFVGYEQLQGARDPEALEWALRLLQGLALGED